MKINTTILKNIVIFIMSVFIGYLCYWKYSMEIINSLYNINNIFKGLFLYSCHILVFYFILKIIFKLHIYTFEKMLVSICYFMLLGVIFFDRVYLGSRILNLNVLDVIAVIKETGFISIILNILVFFPFYTIIKWNFIHLKSLSIFTMFLIFSFGVEIVQYITMSGIFDIVDIMLYVVGYFIGVGVYKILYRKDLMKSEIID